MFSIATIKLAVTKIALSTTIFYAQPAPHAYTKTVSVESITAGLDRATAKLSEAK